MSRAILPVKPVVLDQLSILKLVTARLDAAGIRYMVTGSIAAGYYGQPRMTRDIDLVVELHETDAERFVAAIGEGFLCDADIVRDAIARQTMFNATHQESLTKIDCVVRKDSAFRLEKFDRRRRVEIDGHELWVVALEDLIRSKLVWAKDSRSELQLRDVRHIIALQPGLDWKYLERWAASLTVSRLLTDMKP